MNRYILKCALALFALFSFGSANAQDNVIDRVEWVVGDKAILRSDIEEAIRYWLSTGRKFEGDPYCVVGEDLAVQQLFLPVLRMLHINKRHFLPHFLLHVNICMEF